MRAILFAYLLAGLLAALGSPLLALTMLEPGCETDTDCLEQTRLCKLDSAHCEER